MLYRPSYGRRRGAAARRPRRSVEGWSRTSACADFTRELYRLSYLDEMETVGVEPTFPVCKTGVVPLDHAPSDAALEFPRMESNHRPAAS